MQHISFQLQELPNRKYYGEMVWENKKDRMNVDEASTTPEAVLSKMLPGVKIMIRTRVYNYLSWRKNSFTMTNRQPMEITAISIEKMYTMVRLIMSAGSVTEVAKLIVKYADAVCATKPACDNHLWKDMDCMLTWAEMLANYNSTHIRVHVKDKAPAVRS